MTCRLRETLNVLTPPSKLEAQSHHTLCWLQRVHTYVHGVGYKFGAFSCLYLQMAELYLVIGPILIQSNCFEY